jgi:Asp/Glu/hydantoin racemase
MKVAVLNPNTSEAMTRAVVAELARRCPDARFAGVTAARGDAVIDSRAAYERASLRAAELAAQAPGDCDAWVLACFGDPGLATMRAATAVPVLGMAETALQAAAAYAQPYAMLTAGAGWVPLLQRCASDAGAARWLVDVYALEGNGADVRADPRAFATAIEAMSKRAADAGARRIILAGAAFAGLAFALDERLAPIDTLDALAARLGG